MKSQDPESEEREVLRQCRRGDRRAFGVMVERYKERAYYSAVAFVGSRDDALDLSQEAFVRAFRSIKHFDESKKFFTWYYHILRNLCSNHLRDRARHTQHIISSDGMTEVIDPDSDPQEQTERAERQQAVWSALRELSVDHREIILLKDFQDLSYKEIADTLECPIGTVMSRLYHARRAFKRALQEIWP